MPLLKLAQDDPQKEMAFDIQCSLAIPMDERLKAWLEWNLTMLEFINSRHESSQYPQIIKR
ncbi:hypothetical protein K1X76_12125 [bacterium]|nr:hypothetical protein [bacterium]